MGWLNPSNPFATPTPQPTRQTTTGTTKPSRRERRASEAQASTARRAAREGRTIAIAVRNGGNVGDLVTETQALAQRMLGRTVTRTEAQQWVNSI